MNHSITPIDMFFLRHAGADNSSISPEGLGRAAVLRDTFFDLAFTSKVPAAIQTAEAILENQCAKIDFATKLYPDPDTYKGAKVLDLVDKLRDQPHSVPFHCNLLKWFVGMSKDAIGMSRKSYQQKYRESLQKQGVTNVLVVGHDVLIETLAALHCEDERLALRCTDQRLKPGEALKLSLSPEGTVMNMLHLPN